LEKLTELLIPLPIIDHFLFIIPSPNRIQIVHWMVLSCLSSTFSHGHSPNYPSSEEKQEEDVKMLKRN